MTRTSLDFVLFLTALVILTCAPANTFAAPATLPAIPTVVDLQMARTRVNQVYGDDITRAKTPADKAALAKKLMDAAGETKDDRPAKYALLEMSRDLAVKGGNAETALAAISAFDPYPSDVLQAKTDVLASTYKALRTRKQTLGLMTEVNALIDTALSQSRYPIARQLAEMGVGVARFAEDDEVLTSATVRLDDGREIESASLIAATAAARLSANPRDSASKLILGRFDAFLLQRWGEALPLLAEGSDANLKPLAVKELASPATPTERVALADKWWEAADREKGAAHRNIRLHALGLYNRALPSLSGLEKLKVEKRIGEGAAGPSPTGAAGDLLKRVAIDHDVVSGEWAMDGASLVARPGGAPARIKLPTKVGDNYEFAVEFQRSGKDAKEDGFALFMPVGANQVMLIVRAYDMGLDTVGGKRFYDNATNKKGGFATTGKHVVDVKVGVLRTEARVVVSIDGKQEIDWKGSTEKLGLDASWSMPSDTTFGLGAWRSGYTVTKIQLRDGAPQAR